MLERSLQILRRVRAKSCYMTCRNRWFATTTSQQQVSTTDNNGIVIIGLNNPRRRNALSTQVLQSLYDQLQTAKSNPNTKVVIIKSNSDPTIPSTGVFCSGHDLNELQQQQQNCTNSKKGEQEEDKNQYRTRLQSLFQLCSNVMIEISTFPVPTIAQVDGIATAAGCQLVATCDLAIATSTSKFATPGVNIGLFCSTPAVPLVRTVANKHAMEMLLTGDLISAQRAYEIGLINHVVSLPTTTSSDNPPTKEEHQQLCQLLEENVHNLAMKIANKSKSCNELGLSTLRCQRTLSNLEDAYQVAEQAMIHNLQMDDATEGIDAFLSKRPPSWKT